MQRESFLLVVLLSTSRTNCRYASRCTTRYMRDKGVHIWEGRAGLPDTAHTDEDLDRVVSAFRETLAEMQAADFLPKCADVPDDGSARGRWRLSR